MLTKSFSVEVKDADEGVVTARFATLGVKDHDGDVIAPGAFGEQQVKVSAYGHQSWQGALPPGKGTIREEGDEAIAELRFFMDSDTGREHFNVVKGLGELGEWSFGFDVEEEAAPDEEQEQAGVKRVLKKLTVHEVSPVLRGAGVGTQTLAVKAREEPFSITRKMGDAEVTYRGPSAEAVRELAEADEQAVETKEGGQQPAAETKEPESVDPRELAARSRGLLAALEAKGMLGG